MSVVTVGIAREGCPGYTPFPRAKSMRKQARLSVGECDLLFGLKIFLLSSALQCISVCNSSVEVQE